MNTTPTRAVGMPRRLISFVFDSKVVPTAMAIPLVRLATGGVFVVSGLLKFLYENQGPGRFAKIGLPTQLSGFVGTVEIFAGALLLLGLFVRLAAVPLVVDMVVAIVTTKIPLLFGTGPEPIAAPPRTGWWAFAYQARLDVTMLLACCFLFAVGAGAWSLDRLLARRGRLPSMFVDRDPATPVRSPLTGA